MKKESFLRKMYSKSNNVKYVIVENLNEARKHTSSVAIFEGDYGGIIYLVCPIKFIKCDEEDLNKLMKFIDDNYWNDLAGTIIYYEPLEVNKKIIGGMGGGLVLDEIWIHPEIIKLGIENKIKQILSGEISN